MPVFGDKTTTSASSPSKSQPSKPSIVIPPTPVSAVDANISTESSYKSVPPTSQYTQSTLTSLTCATPLSGLDAPFSRAQASEVNDVPGMGLGLVFSGVVSPDMLAVGEVLSTMKLTLNALSTTFDALGEQTEKVVTLGPAMEASGQIGRLRTELQDLVAEQDARMKKIRHQLEEEVKAKQEHLKMQLQGIIQLAVEREVQEKVRHQLEVQIPENLRQQVRSHKRQILEVQTRLHNSEARRYNATLRSAPLTAPLKPLLLPLFSPTQSFTPSAIDPNPESASPTPKSTSTSTEGGRGDGGLALEHPTASPLFPRDLKSLFSLGPDEARTLVREYDIDGKETGKTSPGNETKGDISALKSPNTSADTTVVNGAADSASDSREHNLTKFMAYIGVPFQMIPVPKPGPNSISSSQGGRRLLSPLIISFGTDSS